MENWDLYDEDLNITGKITKRTDNLPEGYYHLSVEVWIINSNNELLMLRSNYDYSKLYPGLWKCLTGNLVAGEDVYDCITRIFKKKLGISVNLQKVTIYGPTKKKEYRYAYYTCFIKDDIDIGILSVDDNIYMDYEYLDKDELIKKCNNGEIAYYLIDRINNEVIDKI